MELNLLDVRLLQFSLLDLSLILGLRRTRRNDTRDDC
jgi:hypothetical protein